MRVKVGETAQKYTQPKDSWIVSPHSLPLRELSLFQKFPSCEISGCQSGVNQQGFDSQGLDRWNFFNAKLPIHSKTLLILRETLTCFSPLLQGFQSAPDQKMSMVPLKEVDLGNLNRYKFLFSHPGSLLHPSFFPHRCLCCYPDILSSSVRRDMSIPQKKVFPKLKKFGVGAIVQCPVCKRGGHLPCT